MEPLLLLNCYIEICIPGLNISINSLRAERVTNPGIYMSYPRCVAIESNQEVLILKGLMGKKMPALRLCSLSTWFASPLVFISPPIFSSARGKMITTWLSFSKKQNETHTKQTDRQKQKKQAEHPSPYIPPKKKRIPGHPLFIAVALLLSHRGQIAGFLCWLTLCL